MHPQLEEKGFVCLKEISQGIPPVNVHARSIEHAVQNLLSNAIKYSGDSRYIRVKAHVAKGRTNTEEVQITIQDHGLGIKPDELPKIFAPFHRGREVTETNIPGTGLGLSLVKQIMDSNGGRVSVNSVYEEGSAFTLHLPAVRQ
jgi:signal transduction histidine kinase